MQRNTLHLNWQRLNSPSEYEQLEIALERRVPESGFYQVFKLKFKKMHMKKDYSAALMKSPNSLSFWLPHLLFHDSSLYKMVFGLTTSGFFPSPVQSQYGSSLRHSKFSSYSTLYSMKLEKIS